MRNLVGYIYLRGKSDMKLELIPGYPSQISANGIPTNFVWNVKPDGMFQIARIRVGGGPSENDFDLLFEGAKDDCDSCLHQQIEKEYPRLMSQG
jgi:hypothetical protein